MKKLIVSITQNLNKPNYFNMPTITGNQIHEVVDMFNGRGLKIYHACQYRDFKTYIKLNGVPSRNLMDNSGLPYTHFDTDDIDRDNGVWDKVFGNFSDFGNGFAKGQRNENTAPTPNPYGPILFIFHPQVLLYADDIAICLKSAGGQHFNRETEALSTVDDINNIFEYPNIADAPGKWDKSHVAFRSTLQERFGDKKASSPELSCSGQNELFELKYLYKIIVDAYRIDGVSLYEKVNDVKRENNIGGQLKIRSYKEGRKEIKQELANLLVNEFVTPKQITDSDVSGDLKDWANRIIRGQMKFFYNRFAKYLRNGTLLEIKGHGH